MIVEISSKNNDVIKYVKKIISHSKTRKKDGVFLIEGLRLCEEAVKNKVEVIKFFYTSKFYGKNNLLIDKIINTNNSQGYIISEELMEYISDTETPQGIVCLCKMIDKKISIDTIKSYSKIILLENLQNPSNLGSIFRSLDAFGIDLVILSSDSCDMYNPKALRGSMGAIFKLNIMIENDISGLLVTLKKEGFNICSAVPSNKAESVRILADLKKVVAILGNEGNGISKEIIELSDKHIVIPMRENCESLNVAVAAGIISWEMTNRGRNNDG